jgi:hypothetical protein
MKRRIVIGSMLCVSLALGACSKEGSFKSAINQSIQDNYACIHIGEPESLFGLSGFSYESYEKYEKENVAFVIRKRENGELVKNDPFYNKEKEIQLDALVKVGLLDKQQRDEPAIEQYSKKTIENEGFVVELYNLTKQGEKAQKKDNSFYGGTALCYAYPEVERIINYKEASPGGQDIAEVKYSYKYVDIANWAKNKDVQTAFPEIQKTLDEKENIDIAGLEKTNKGWQVGL